MKRTRRWILAAWLLGPVTACTPSMNNPDTSPAMDGSASDAVTPDGGAPDGTAGDVVEEMAPQPYRWESLTSVSAPFIGRWGYSVAAAGDGTAVVFGGADFDAASSGRAYNETYLLDARGPSPVFTRIDATTPPGARWCGCAVYDPRRRRVLAFGGRTTMGPTMPETWVLDPEARTFTRLTVAQSPGFVIGCAMAYAAGRDAIYMYGGANATNVTNETWRFDPEPGTWTRLSPAVSPLSRYDAAFVPVADGQPLLLYGGGRPGRFPTDVWRFDPADESWREITVAGDPPPGRRTPWVAVEPGGGGFLAGFGTTSLQGNETLSDLWRFDFATSSWQDVSAAPADSPAPRGFALYLPAGRGHVGLLVGGYDGTSAVHEIWRLDPPVGDRRW